jgi:hypothetical protein
LGIGLLVLAGVAVVAGLIAAALLGHLETTAAAPDGLSWWKTVLGYGMPTVALLSIAVYLWLSK